MANAPGSGPRGVLSGVISPGILFCLVHVFVVLDVLVQKARLVKEVKDVGTSFHGG